ncbi:MAG TPA: amidase [Rhizomicrobium sp.]|jgi:aspartyl-tRNA(Asn)/glutamyl-tRNA(Gln) amidotransferase subunit A|nr:amidase [Rhizomicrobium sp.]
MNSEIHELSAAELGDAYRVRDLSPVDVVESCLARIAALDAEINAFCFIDADYVRGAAEQSERRWMENAPLSPLDGVPVAIKDLLLTRNWPTRRGSLTVDAKGLWPHDAPAVARLRAAGAILIGKTTTPEFGWKGTTDSPLTGVTRNPWNPKATPGGSSGGSGAALAARLVPLALGTDGGGSIRIPASFCGIFGLKPSFGRVPAWPLSPFGTLAHVGPMSRTVPDSAMLLNVIAQPDARDWHALPFEPRDFTAMMSSVKGKRIAFSPRLGHVERLSAEIETAVALAAQTLAELGAIVEEADPPGGDMASAFRTLWWSGAAFLLRDLPEEKRALLDPGLRDIVESGAAISLREYLSATAARGAYGSTMRQFMETYDFVLTPSVATTAFETGKLAPMHEDGNAWISWTPYSFPFNLTQQPAASMPCGFARDGLPIGLQIAGRMYDDAGVLAVCAAYEQANPLHRHRPAIC